MQHPLYPKDEATFVEINGEEDPSMKVANDMACVENAHHVDVLEQ